MSDDTKPFDANVIELDVLRVQRMATRAELRAYLSTMLARRGHAPELAEKFMSKLEQLTGGRF